MKISVIGTGYVGLVTGACFAHLGHHVVCVDKNSERVEPINQGKATLYEPGLETIIKTCAKKGNLKATTDLKEAVLSSDVTFIAVGTPSNEDGSIDLRYILQASQEIGEVLKDKKTYHIVAVKSTVIPGTTEEVVGKAIEAFSGKKSDAIGLCMNPEFLRQGYAVEDFMHPDRIVIGGRDTRTYEIMLKLYENLDTKKITTTIKNAEMIKYASNTLLATLISFSNEIANICEKTIDTDVNTVLEGVHLDRRLTPIYEGKKIYPGIINYLKAGSGFGGSCLPKDIKALYSYALEKKVDARLLCSVITTNEERPKHFVELIKSKINNLNKAHVALLGLTFKAGTDDLRDSPAIAVLKMLCNWGTTVTVWDPQIDKFHPAIKGLFKDFAKTPEEAIKGKDGVIITTDLTEVGLMDWAQLIPTMKHPIILDGRNILPKTPFPLGAQYYPIGKYTEGTFAKGNNA